MENFIVKAIFPNIISASINGLILVIFAVAVWSGMRLARRYKKHETRYLKKVERKVDERYEQTLSSSSTTTSGEKGGDGSPNELATLMGTEELLEFIRSDSIIFKRIDAIGRMRKRRVKINVDVLQQATYATEITRFGYSFPKLSISLVMILGLFGTFLGLSLMVNKISMIMPSANSLDLSFSSLQMSLREMDTVFKGIKTAFSTSVVGIAATIICLMVNYRIRRKQSIFFHKLEVFTVEKLIPVTVPPVESEHLREEVSFRLQDSFDTLNHAIAQNNSILNNLSEIESAFNIIVGHIKDITNREESRHFENVINLLDKNNDLVGRYVEQWPGIVKVMEDQGKLTENKINTMIGAFERGQEVFTDQYNRLVQTRNGGLVVNFSSKWNLVVILTLVAVAAISLMIVL